MCGIAGIYNYRAGPVSRTELAVIRDHMAARGPDGSGAWFSSDQRVGLGHRRLSLIDLSEKGAQPMASADGKYVITFNGEIYNYRALRAALEAQGRVFVSESDTEVLLHLYQTMGAAMVTVLRGMFAFALWDVEKAGLLLARDPYGIKPLYLADDGKSLRFASQVKALLAGGQVSRDPDSAGWVGFHLFGSVPEPFTTYRAIRALPAGSTLWIDAAGAATPGAYFNIAETFVRAEQAPLDLPQAELQDYLRQALLDSVRDHMVADVPVGIFLSSGVDSGALLGLMRDTGQQQIDALTLTYEEFRTQAEDEGPLAARCARLYGSRHSVRVVTPKEFRDDLPLLFAAMDQPTTDGINTWFVAKATREFGLKAAISGLGGDELIGGYPSFRDVPRRVRYGALSHLHLDGLFRLFAEATGLDAVLHPKAAGVLRYAGGYAGAYFLSRGIFMPWELDKVMEPGMAKEGLALLEPVRHIAQALQPSPRSSFAKVAVMEASFYMRNQLLRDADWASMAHSLEVRVPLVDAKLLSAFAPATAQLAGGRGKKYLAQSPRIPLPREITDRRKTGFITPISQWLQQENGMQAWRRIPQLNRARCPWARRWAYQVAAA